jgi:SAM-dependent methyltransferase
VKPGPYDEFYYAHYCGSRPYRRDPEWLEFFASIAAEIVARIAPRSALDAGCAMGMLVEALRDRGVEAEGVDISPYAIEQARPDVRPHCRVASVADPFGRRYDLIVCIEVLEHLPAREAERAIANLCRFTEDVVFTSTPEDFREATHLNVQPPEYWAEAFARHGFFRDVEFDATFIAPWGQRFRKAADPLPRVIAAYERRLWRLEREIRAQRQLAIEHRGQLAAGQEQIGSLSGAAADLQSRLDAALGNLGNLTAALDAERQAAAGERRRRFEQEYRREVEQIRKIAVARTPAGSTLTIISGGDDALLDLAGRRAWHFPRMPDGCHTGEKPVDARDAVGWLEAHRCGGAQFLVVPATARWWLQHYAGFRRHLRRRYRKIYDGAAGTIFDLRDSPSAARCTRRETEQVPRAEPRC